MEYISPVARFRLKVEIDNLTVPFLMVLVNFRLFGCLNSKKTVQIIPVSKQPILESSNTLFYFQCELF